MSAAQHKLKQPLLIVLLIIITAILATLIWFKNKPKIDTASDVETTSEPAEQAVSKTKTDSESTTTEHAHEDENELELTVQDMVEHGVQKASVQKGSIDAYLRLPGRLTVNTDQQAHISPNFSGHVEAVYVALGQQVKKGQVLAVLSVPELIDLQSNLKMAQAALDLARQDQQREQQLWSQGISAKQDLQRAQNAYRQAQITVQATQSRLSALGASTGTQGRFQLTAPMSGIISQKDIVVGENVQLADQLFVIEQQGALWLEFNIDAQNANQLQTGQSIQFVVNGQAESAQQSYPAVIQTLNTQADQQTGRLVVRAKLNNQTANTNQQLLRPNMLVNVFVPESASKIALKVQTSAIQRVDNKDVIFVITSTDKDKLHLQPQNVVLGQRSQDGQWIEVLSGVKEGQNYIAKGSFLLKSELEKDEAGHEH